jgi:MFS family permease
MASTTWVRSHLQSGTLSAMRHRNFRLYFGGQLVSLSGTWMQGVAQGWLVFYLTKSELWLGIVACAAGLPSLLLSPFAGVLVERISRRRIIIITQIVQMLLAFTLSLLTFTGMVQVWHVVGLAFILGITNAVDAPARQTFISDMVGHDDRSSGIALNSIMINSARIVGPAVAGIVLATFGAGWCFLFNGLSFLAVIYSLILMKVQSPIQRLEQRSPLQQLREGFNFARRHPVIGPLLLLAIVCSLTTINIVNMLPAFADTVLHSPILAYAQMNMAQGVGAVCAGILVATLGRRYGRGQVVTVMTAFTPLASLLLSQTTRPEIAVPLMGVFGFGMILMFITINTMIQSEVPDEFRGRVMSLYTLTFFGISPFGALLLGQVAEVIGTAEAVALYSVIGLIFPLAIMLRSRAARRAL